MQRVVDFVFQDEGIRVLPYIDDVMMHNSNIDNQIDTLERCLKKLSLANLSVKPSKTTLFAKSIEFLGYKISKDRIQPQQSKMDAIREFPTPRKQKDVRSFLGALNYQSSFIPDYAYLARPLQKLTGKNAKFVWSDECDASFNKLKENVHTTDIKITRLQQSIPDYNRCF